MLLPSLLYISLSPVLKQGAVPAFSRGSSLVNDCQQQANNDPPNIHAGFCLGFAKAVRDAITSGLITEPKICFGGASVGTMVKVYLLYMTKNPKRLDDEQLFGFIDAMVETYPCSKAP